MINMIKRISSVVLATVILFASLALGTTLSKVDADAASTTIIDNSKMVDKWVPDSQLTLDEYDWPTYTKDMVLAECRIECASTDGTVFGMDKVLKHLAETGVNALWVTPIEDKGLDDVGSTYCAYGPHTINPYITGQIKYGEPWHQVDYKESRKIIKQFVDMCHSYNIRIYFDKVPWGVAKCAPILVEHPEWAPTVSEWGGMNYNKSNTALRDYYYDSNVEFIVETGCDGIRWDLEPHHFGYEFISAMHADLLENYGRKVLFFSEDMSYHGGSYEYGAAYAFEQFGGVHGAGASSQYWTNLFFDDIDIVEAIQTGDEIGITQLRNTGESGKYRYYCYQISSHDDIYFHEANLAHWSYQFLYGSFIPLFYVGEELCANTNGGSVFGWPINGSVAYNVNKNGTQNFIPSDNFDNLLKDPVHREYFENVKELIGYKWQYKNIINKSTDNHRNTNICSVKVKGSNIIKGYARYDGQEGFMVIPNVNEDTDKAVTMTVSVPLKNMKLDGYSNYSIVNIQTKKVVASGNASQVASFKESVAHNTCNMYLVVAGGSKAEVDKKVKQETKSDNVREVEDYDYLDDDDDYDDSDDSALEDEGDIGDEEGNAKKAVRRRRLVSEGSDGFPTWAIIAIIAGAVVLLGGGATAFFLIRKRK